MENTAQSTNQQQLTQSSLPDQTPSVKSLTQEPLPTLEKTSLKLPVFIIFTVIILFLVFLKIYFSIGKNIRLFKPIILPTPVITLSPKKIGFTTHWSTFVSSFGYSIKYPSECKIYKTSWMEESDKKQFVLEDDDEAVIRYREQIQASESASLNGFIIRLKRPVDNPNNLSAREWLKKNYPVLSLIKIEDIKVAEIDSIKAASLLEGQIVYVLIPYKEKIFQIVKQSIGTTSSYDNDQMFNQILTTIEFSDRVTPFLSPTRIEPEQPTQATTSSLL